MHFKHHRAAVTTVRDRHNEPAEVRQQHDVTWPNTQQELNQLQRKSMWQTRYLSKALNSHTKCVCVTSCLELINTLFWSPDAEGVSGSREVWTSLAPFASSWIADVSWLNVVFIAAAPGQQTEGPHARCNFITDAPPHADAARCQQPPPCWRHVLLSVLKAALGALASPVLNNPNRTTWSIMFFSWSTSVTHFFTSVEKRCLFYI